MRAKSSIWLFDDNDFLPIQLFEIEKLRGILKGVQLVANLQIISSLVWKEGWMQGRGEPLYGNITG